MQRNSIDEYIGPNGGFGVAEGSYSGVAVNGLDLRTSGVLSLRSENKNINIHASGDYSSTSLGNTAISSEGSLILSTSTFASITGVDIVLQSDDDILIQADDVASLIGDNNVLVSSLNGIVHIEASDTPNGSVFIVGHKGIELQAAGNNVGTLSGIASDRINLISSGYFYASSQNNDLEIDASGFVFIQSRNEGVNITAFSDFIVVSNQVEINTTSSLIHLDSAEDVRLTSQFDLVSSANHDHRMSSGRDWEMTGSHVILLNNNESALSDGISGISRTRITMRASGQVALDAPNGHILLQASGNLRANVAGVIRQYARGIEIATAISNNLGGSLSGLSTGTIDLLSSGTMNLRSQNGDMNIQSSGIMTLGGWQGAWTISENGKSVLFQSAPGGTYTIIPGGNLLFSAGGTSILAGGSSTLITCVAGNTTITSQLADTSVGSLKGQLTLNPWNASGQLRYQFGPNEAWHTSPSHTSSFFPIAHSGQVKQMLLEQVTLQTAYAAGNNLVAKDSRDIMITAADAKIRLGSDSTQPHISMSGMFVVPSTNRERGDVWMSYNESVAVNGGVTTAASSDALSLGPATLALVTGSGVINLSTGSGITQLVNTAISSISSQTYVKIAWNDSIPLVSGQFRDRHYSHATTGGTNAGDIRVLVPGLYRIYYNINCRINTAPTEHNSIGATLDINGTKLSVGKSYTNLFRGSEAVAGDERSLSAATLININAGDLLSLQWHLESATTGYVIDSLSDQTWIILEYIGPRRSL